MSESVPLCTHIKTDGIRCGSPAVSGTALCHHHSVIKTTLAKTPARRTAGIGGFEPIPFVFAEDRASMQLNYHLLLTAFNESRVDLRTFKLMMSILKAMAKNLGKTGSLLDVTSDQRPASSNQKNGIQPPAVSKQETTREIAPEPVSLSAAAEPRKPAKPAATEFFPTTPDYSFLPSVTSRSIPNADSFRSMARQAARMRW